MILPVAERELRTAARQPRTYYSRMAVAGVGVVIFGVAVWLMNQAAWLSGSASFAMLSWVAWVYSALAGIFLTSDCISAEKREETLGLLFLTDLKGYDVVLGKLVASSLLGIYGLIALFPVLALPLLMGGVSPVEFGRVILTLLNTLLFSIGVGIFVSSVGRHPYRVLGVALLVLASFVLGLPILSALAHENGFTQATVNRLLIPNPAYAQILAVEPAFSRFPGRFWLSWSISLGIGLIFLVTSCCLLPRIWRERSSGPKLAFLKQRLSQIRFGSPIRRQSFRKKLLNQNPFYWLASRGQITSLGFMVFLVTLGVLGITLAWTWRTATPSDTWTLGAVLVVWGWGGALLHLALLYKIASTASHCLAQDRASGALELVLSTPLKSRVILWGHCLSLIRQLSGPTIAALLVHLLFLWGILHLYLLDKSLTLSPSQLLQFAWSQEALRHQNLEWEFAIAVRTICLLMVVALSAWLALACAGTWIALRVKAPRLAPWFCLALTLAPPFPIIIGIIILGVQFEFLWGELLVITWVLTGALTVFIVHHFFIVCWSLRNLRRYFRSAVTDPFQIHQPGFPILLLKRVAMVTVALGLTWASFHGIENWRGERAWNRLQTQVNQSGRSLTPLLPPPIPELENMALAPPFDSVFVSSPSIPQGKRAVPPTRAQSNPNLNLYEVNLFNLQLTNNGRIQMPSLWPDGRVTDFIKWRDFFYGTTAPAPEVRAKNPAATVLEVLNAAETILAQVREAARRPKWQIPPGNLVTQFSGDNVSLLEGLKSVLFLRSLCRLELGQIDAALSDLALIQRLSQALDTDLSTAAYEAKIGFEQPAIHFIWEGIRKKRLNSAHLVQLQTDLDSINLFQDYLRAIESETLHQIESWNQAVSQPSDSHLQPRFTQFHRWFYPKGWARLNQVALYRVYTSVGIPRVNADAQTFVPDSVQPVEEQWISRGPLIAPDSFKDLVLQIASRFAFTQTTVLQAKIACAIERFRIDTGTFPSSLDALVPNYLSRPPVDPGSGKPFIYQTIDNSYLLYSVGWNGLDDGGIIDKGDWVWRP